MGIDEIVQEAVQSIIKIHEKMLADTLEEYQKRLKDHMDAQTALLNRTTNPEQEKEE